MNSRLYDSGEDIQLAKAEYDNFVALRLELEARQDEEEFEKKVKEIEGLGK